MPPQSIIKICIVYELKFLLCCEPSILSIPSYRKWDQTNLVLNTIGKVKPGSLLSSMCMFPELNGTKL